MIKKNPTIKDIAKKAKVSEATISRYMNKKYQYMSEDTRKRIKKIVEELEYQPSNIARTLKSKKSNLIGAIISDIENPFSNRVIKGLSDIADELDYTLLVAVSNESTENEQKYIQRFLNNGVDGIILNTANKNDEYIKEASKKIPIVLIDRELTNYKLDTVTSNNYDLGKQLIHHLLDNQFKSIGYITNNIDSNSVRQIRYSSFKDTIEERPDLISKEYIVEVHDEEKIIEFLHEFRKMPAPRAILANNGVMLLSVIQAIKEVGYTIPDDFAITGFDDSEWARISDITTIKQESYSIGREALAMLRRRIEGESSSYPVYIEIPGDIMFRKSTIP